MDNSYVDSLSLAKLPLWEKIENKRRLLFFELEITARCNLNCRHCYINLPLYDEEAKSRELSFAELKEIVDEAVSLGAMWCLISGGEPLLREDFFDIYLYLKKRGLLISIFTNATLIKKEYIRFFKKYPPRDIEITVYGVTPDTYERVTRRPGSFDTFMAGLNLLLKNDIKVRLKTMALRSNVQELPEIAYFCQGKTKDYFRFDPFLHLRYDGVPVRNDEIKSERLSPEEIARIEQADSERLEALKKGCNKLINPEFSYRDCNHLFICGAGEGAFSLSYDGLFRLCSSLWHPDCLYDIKKGTLTDAWQNFVPRVRDIRSQRKEFLEGCRICPLFNLCMWCPANAYLETGELDKPVDYFCQIAHARERILKGITCR